MTTATIEQIKNTKFSPEDIEVTEQLPCNRCGEATAVNVGYVKLFGGSGTCKCCMHAYYCYLFAHEIRKAGYKKKDTEKNVAVTQLSRCAHNFSHRYGCDWRDQMRKASFNIDNRLGENLADPIGVYQLINDAKQRGFLV